MGETRDDAAGEAFDKGARILGLGYPGGIEIEKAARGGDSTVVNFPRAFFKTDSIEFSFSGLKTSLLRYVENLGGEVPRDHMPDVAASYQSAIVESLLSKLRLAVDRTGIGTALIGGGVAANRKLRERAGNLFSDCKILYPDIDFCTDNAAMVAFLGEIYLREGKSSINSHCVVPNLRLSD
jgi:N6-L-threonylcarbamoyladenine synthase